MEGQRSGDFPKTEEKGNTWAQRTKNNIAKNTEDRTLKRGSGRPKYKTIRKAKKEKKGPKKRERKDRRRANKKKNILRAEKKTKTLVAHEKKKKKQKLD
jgi:hypothetical protein